MEVSHATLILVGELSLTRPMFTIDSNSPYIIEVDDVLSPEECDALVLRIESLNPELAPINTRGGAAIRTDVRNNERVMFDDEALASQLLERVREHVPRHMRGRELVGANERFRCYRYREGMRFAPHADGAFQRDEREMSFYTFLVYLNAGFVGGETRFFTKPELVIEPRPGLGLLFQHPLVHEGAEVVDGVKYVARTDLMYRRMD